MPKVNPVPDGYNTVSTYLVVNNALKALDFYAKAFGARIGTRMPGPMPDSTVHAEMRIGDSSVMLTDENPQWDLKSPDTLGGSPASMHLYVEDADAVFAAAVEAGAEVVLPIMDAFWGDRYGKIKDPFGHQWGIATRKEELTAQEMIVRQKEWMASMAGGEDCGQ
jgi:uncharacterized glyoxalase superfamily protein PhnB